MMDATREVGPVSVFVKYGHVLEFYLVRYHHQCIAFQLVSGVEGGHSGFPINDEVACQVDVVEGACQSDVALCMPCDMAKEGLGETVHEVQVRALGIDLQVDGFMHGRYIAVD